MAHDFREVKAAVMNTVKEMDKKDPNWKWKAVVQKAQIKIFWSYLEYKGEIPPFIITDGPQRKRSVVQRMRILLYLEMREAIT